MEASKCPKCGEEPHFLEHIEKWYCYGCNAYIEDGVEHICSEEAKKEECAEAIKIKKELKALDGEPKAECKNCGAELEGLKDGKLYCFVCESYQDGSPSKPVVPSKEANDSQKLLDSVLGASEVKPQPAPSEVEPKPEPALDTPKAPVVADPVATQVRMCPTCGQALKWIEKYQRHYCYGCKKYAPKDEVKKSAEQAQPAPAHSQAAKACPGCGGELKFIEKYSEYYCFSCKKYPLREAKSAEPVKTELKKAPEPAAEMPKKSGEPSCPKCRGQLRWIEKYSRYYCNSCKEYAPKGYGAAPVGQGEKRICPQCKEQMRFVAEYNEWYCYKCKKYSLRPSKPVLLM